MVVAEELVRYYHREAEKRSLSKCNTTLRLHRMNSQKMFTKCKNNLII